LGVEPRSVAATSVILSHESVFSGVRASFVKRQAFKSFNRCAPFKPFKPTSDLRVQSSNNRYPAVVKSILDFRPFGVAQDRFWILDSDRITAPLFSLFIFSTKFKLPTATASDHRAFRTYNSSRRAIPTHYGDELAESPLVSKSRITQIVRVSRSLDNASAVAGSHDSCCSPTYRMVDHACADHIQVNIHQTAAKKPL
jgi:hypothetical protein